MANLVVDTPDVRVYEGEAAHWSGPEAIDIVFTNPYGAMPPALKDTPMIIHQWVHRKHEAERWCGHSLDFLIGTWNERREAFWCTNIADPYQLSLDKFKPEPGGWYPEDMVRRIFAAYVPHGATVWDGFMGRGTVAKIAREFGNPYVGVERLPAHIQLAKDYLHL